jgi:hypothetical protein
MQEIASQEENAAQCNIKVREVMKNGLETNTIPD